MTPFLNLTGAVRNELLEPTAVLPAARIKRGRLVPAQMTDPSAIFIRSIRSSAERLDIRGLSRKWETVIEVSSYARATSGQDGDAAVDPLLAAVYARLHAMTPPAGVESVSLEPQIDWDIEEADQTLGGARLYLRCVHITTGAALAAG